MTLYYDLTIDLLLCTYCVLHFMQHEAGALLPSLPPKRKIRGKAGALLPSLPPS